MITSPLTEEEIEERRWWFKSLLKRGYQTHPLACPYIIILYIK
jgi:hypothetical protein